MGFYISFMWKGGSSYTPQNQEWKASTALEAAKEAKEREKDQNNPFETGDPIVIIVSEDTAIISFDYQSLKICL